MKSEAEIESLYNVTVTDIAYFRAKGTFDDYAREFGQQEARDHVVKLIERRDILKWLLGK